MAQEPVIKVHDLVVGFGDQIVLDHLSLDVRGGEILVVVGASGSGKSVLLRTVIGLLPKRHGSIEVLGVDGEAATAPTEDAVGEPELGIDLGEILVRWPTAGGTREALIRRGDRLSVSLRRLP